MKLYSMDVRFTDEDYNIEIARTIEGDEVEYLYLELLDFIEEFSVVPCFSGYDKRAMFYINNDEMMLFNINYGDDSSSYNYILSDLRLSERAYKLGLKNGGLTI